MKCEQCTQALSALIDNELDDFTKQEVMAHIEQCTVCEEALLTLRLIQKEIGSITHIALPEGFHEEMMERVAKETQDPLELVIKPLKWTKKLAGLSTALAAAFLLIVTLETDQVSSSNGAATMEMALEHENVGVGKIDSPSETSGMVMQGEMRTGVVKYDDHMILDRWLIIGEGNEALYETIEHKMVALDFVFTKKEEGEWLVLLDGIEDKAILKAHLMELVAIEVLEEDSLGTSIQISMKK